MVVKLEKDNNYKLILKGENNIKQENKSKIELLNQDKFFKDKYTNRIGRIYVYYLCNSVYETLNNAEPVNLQHNTLSKNLRRILVIDSFIKKTISNYKSEDLNNFISSFVAGEIKAEGIRQFKREAINGYVGEFKRFWKIYRQYKLISDPDDFKQIDYEWGMNLKAPIMKKQYEKVKEFSIKEVEHLSNSLAKEEYGVRAALTVNLMGRKCEVKNVSKGMLDLSQENTTWLQLPEVKKHSTEKVPVELYSFVRKRLLDYLEHNNFSDDDLLFPSKDAAFAKNLKEVSKKLFNFQVSPKTLRKIGLDIATELGYDRAECERIGGWEANSPVIAHYFNRKKVGVKKKVNKKIDEELYKDIHVELDKTKAEYSKMKKENLILLGRMQVLEEKSELLVRLMKKDSK